jgi:DNA-directed RNA polymerase specialized sigma24 family protein
MSDSDFLQLYPYARRIAGIKANELAAKRLCAEHEREDICQDLLLDLWLRLPKFNREKSSLRTFAALVMTRNAISLGEARTCAKRDVRKCQRSLDDPARYPDRNGRDAENVGPLSATIPAAEASRMHSCIRRIDVQRAIGKLPRDLRKIARALATNDNRAEAALVADVSLATLYRKIRVIRKIFIDADLQTYAAVSVTGRRGKQCDCYRCRYISLRTR